MHFSDRPEFMMNQITLASNQRLLLTAPDSLFILEQGGMDLFALFLANQPIEQITLDLQKMADAALPLTKESLKGPLIFLRQINAGQWLAPFPLDYPRVPYCIVAIARENCLVTRLSLSNLQKALPHEPLLQTEVMKQIQEWLHCLQTLNLPHPPSSAHSILHPYERTHLESQTNFMTLRLSKTQLEHSFYWLKLYQGQVYLWGLPSICLQTDSVLYPLDLHTWVHCEQPTELEIFPTHPEFTLRQDFWSGLFLYQTHFLHLLMYVQQDLQAKDKEKIRWRIDFDRTLLEHSLGQLQTVLKPSTSSVVNLTLDPLFRACQLLGSHLELKFTNPKKSNSKNLEDHIHNICLSSQIYYRRINLKGRWDESNAIPLLAFYGKDQKPVVLLPHTSVGYRMIDPETGKSQKVRDQVASQILPFGYMFYRQLPDHQLSFKNLLSFSVWYRGRDWISFIILVLCGTLASLSFPLITSYLFDVVIPNHNITLFFEMALAAILITCATLVFNFSRESIILRLEGLTDHDLEMAVWQRLISLPMSFFRKYSIYDLFTFTSAISSMRQVLSSHVLLVLLNSIFASLFLGLMFYYSAFLTFLSLPVLAVQVLGSFIPLFLSIRYERQSIDRRINASNKMLEMVEGLTKIRLAGAEIRMFHRWEQAFSKMQQMDLKILLLHMKAMVFTTFWSSASLWILYLGIIILLQSVPSLTSGAQPLGFTPLSLGNFMAFIAAFSFVYGSLSQLGGTLLQIISIIPLWEKAKSFSQTELEKFSSQNDPGTLKGEIRVDHLTFSYQPGMAPVLNDISIHIHPGEAVAFVGTSGCGKSTLLRLLLGFEIPQQGSIYYDSKDIKQLNLQMMRSQLGVVLQTGAIFDGSILDNINSGRNYTAEQVHEAIELSGMNVFIKDFPMGIHTVLTNGGQSLSGGQRQLILLARALVGKPTILMLDEATSALDNQKQKVVHDHLDRLEMTRLIVAHRLSTVQHADRIYVLDKGHIVDHGSFNELAARPGLFADLLEKQKLS